MTYCIQNNDIYDQQGNILQADDKGIVKIVIDNKERRFVKDKFINYLQKNPVFIKNGKAVKIKKEKPVKVEKIKPVKVPKPRKKQKPRVIETITRVRKGTSITAQKDGVVYGPFISMAACGRAIGMRKGTVLRIMQGAVTKSGWEFFKQ